MDELRCNGREVRLSNLSQRVFKARSCDLLLPITPRNQSEMLAEFRRAGEFGRYNGLRIAKIADLSFLQEFPNLLYLEVVDQSRVNTRPLEFLTNLRGLRMDSPGAGIDFSWFPELEVFVGDWHADNRNLAASRELRTLSIRQFKSLDLSVFAPVTRLETLEVTKTDISSVDGVEALEDLRYLDIAYAPKLTSLESLATGSSGIREFSLSHAKAVRSYLPLASVNYLRRLKLSSCAPMPDLKWTRGMNRLDFFSFVETNVGDGDLSPLFELPALRYVGTMDKRHYNYRSQRINELLEQRARDGASLLNHQ